MLREPPKGPLYARAEVYRARAEELRIIAEDMHCGETRRVCLSIAAGYERLACQVGAPAARHHGLNGSRPLRRGDQGRRRPRAGPEKPGRLHCGTRGLPRRPRFASRPETFR